jgi:hypothetical protein
MQAMTMGAQLTGAIDWVFLTFVRQRVTMGWGTLIHQNHYSCVCTRDDPVPYQGAAHVS